jgi:hypothetical protein
VHPPAPAPTVVAAVAPIAPAPAVAAPAVAASRDTQITAIAAGGSATAEMYGPEKPKATAKRRHAKAAHAPPTKPKSKIQVARTTTGATPAASPDFPFDQPFNRANNSFAGSRASDESRTR